MPKQISPENCLLNRPSFPECQPEVSVSCSSLSSKDALMRSGPTSDPPPVACWFLIPLSSTGTYSLTSVARESGARLWPPELGRSRQGDHGFETRLGYLRRLYLLKKKKNNSLFNNKLKLKPQIPTIPLEEPSWANDLCLRRPWSSLGKKPDTNILLLFRPEALHRVQSGSSLPLLAFCLFLVLRQSKLVAWNSWSLFSLVPSVGITGVSPWAATPCSLLLVFTQMEKETLQHSSRAWNSSCLLYCSVLTRVQTDHLGHFHRIPCPSTGFLFDFLSGYRT